MQKPQQKSFDEMSFTEKMEIVQGLMTLLALTIAVFLRRNLGYRFLHPGRLLATGGFFFVVGTLAQESPNHEVFQVIGILIPVFGLMQRFRRWLEIRRGIRQHSYYIGDSIFESKRTPKFLQRRRIPRFCDPLFCIIGGAFLLGVCPLVGMWLIAGGFALRVMEDTVHRKELDRDLDTMDGMIVSGVQAETVDRFSDPTAEELQEQQDAAGIATGLSPDLQSKITPRKPANPRRA